MAYVPATQGTGTATGAAPAAGAAGTAVSPFSQIDVVTGRQARHRRGAAVNGVEPAAQTITTPTTTSASTLVNSLVGLSPTEMLALQDKLIAAGLLAKTARTGVADSATRDAYSELLQNTSAYNSDGQNLTPDELLQRSINARATADASKQALNDGKPGNVTHLDSGLDLESQVQSAAQSRLGRKLKPGEVTKFVTIYRHMQQVDSTQSAAAQQMATATAATETAPGVNGVSSAVRDTASPGAAADQFIDHNFAQEAAGQSASSYFGALEHLIGGGR